MNLLAWILAAEPPGEERVRQELERVFSRPEFDQSTPDHWLDFLKWLARFFSWLGSLSGDNPTLFWAIFVGCVALLVLLVGHIGWVIYRAVYFESGPARGERLAESRRRLSARFHAEAEERAAGGDYTGAVRCLFLSLVYAFDESGRLLFRPAATNREYLRYFSDRPALEEHLRFFVDLLDDNWYGQSPTEPADYAHALALYDTLLRQG
jgi:hypothetical protein